MGSLLRLMLFFLSDMNSLFKRNQQAARKQNKTHDGSCGHGVGVSILCSGVQRFSYSDFLFSVCKRAVFLLRRMCVVCTEVCKGQPNNGRLLCNSRTNNRSTTLSSLVLLRGGSEDDPPGSSSLAQLAKVLLILSGLLRTRLLGTLDHAFHPFRLVLRQAALLPTRRARESDFSCVLPTRRTRRIRSRRARASRRRLGSRAIRRLPTSALARRRVPPIILQTEGTSIRSG